MFESTDKLKGGDKVYVVLDQIKQSEGSENESLSFGLKVVNKDGEQLSSSSTNALIVTENSAGLINIQGWYQTFIQKNGVQINEANEDMLKRNVIFPKFQIKASEIDSWLKGGADVDREEWGGILNQKLQEIKDGRKIANVGDLLHSKWFESNGVMKLLLGEKTFEIDVKITAEWISWCGNNGNQRDKRLKDGNQIEEGKIGNYAKANKEVKLRVGSTPSSSKDDVWALIPLNNPIIKIKLDKEKVNNETITGTLEPMKDSFY